MDMSIKVNGKDWTFREGTTVANLLDELGLNRDGVAVAVDSQVVPRSEHDDRALEDGNAVEVIRAVGGG